MQRVWVLGIPFRVMLPGYDENTLKKKEALTNYTYRILKYIYTEKKNVSRYILILS